MSLKKSSLARLGYESFEDWNSNPNHLYIGRDMSHHVPGALGSKWGNPFKAKKANKNSLNKCLKRYEDHVRRNPDLFTSVMELEGKELGCWCKPYPCHGDILIKLFKERQSEDLCSSRYNYQKPSPVLTPCGSNGDSDEGKDLFMNDPDVWTPLRLNGGADTSHAGQEENYDSRDISNESDPLSVVSQEGSMSDQDIRDVLFDAGYTIEDINEIITLKSESNESACQSKPGNASTASATNSTSGYSSSARAMEIIQVYW